MKRKITYLFILITITSLLGTPIKPRIEATTNQQTHNLSDNFQGNEKIEETESLDKSQDKYWWLNSGGYFFRENGIGKTFQGNVSNSSRWFWEYKESNPVDTDGGVHPQNIFRLITKGKWQNFDQEAYFKVKKYHLSGSPERYASNGLFLINRFQDSDNLYYTGLRVDGTLVIKKKFDGKYYTLAQRKIIDGEYDRKDNPNLIPVDEKIGLKCSISNLEYGKVLIQLLVDNGENWQLMLAVTDARSGNISIIDNPGLGGIRTDFMDVEFYNYSIVENAS